MRTVSPSGSTRLLAVLAGFAVSLGSILMAVQAWGQSMREELGAGDTVRITAYRHPDLTTEARLSEQGKVNVPMLGEITLQGMTPEQAAGHIADRLRQGNFLLNPQIGVAVVQARSRQVSVLGFVARPGRYVLDGSSARLSDVIAMAGGLQETASDTVTVQRNLAGENETITIDLSSIMQHGDVSKNIEIRSGDSVFVTRAPVFYIYGEVERGGAYRLEPDMTVTQAIALAGGITPRGSERRLQVRRRGADGQWKESTVRLLDRVSADDVIFVRESLF
jgi:polysaccharide biosynthesis/export protein